METRLNKYIAGCGAASRRAADRMIEEGRVTVNGVKADLGTKVTETDIVEIDGKAISSSREIILLFHKPRGITCTSDRGDPTNVIDFIGFPERIFSIGRLDKDSEGLLIMTNNGDLANKIMFSREGHEKEYIVTVDKPVTRGFLSGLSGGVPIGDGIVTRKCTAVPVSKYKFRIILRQGLNRQIRRMCEYYGYNVVRLVRVRIMNLVLDGIEPGKYRDITDDEYHALIEELGISGSRRFNFRFRSVSARVWFYLSFRNCPAGCNFRSGCGRRNSNTAEDV